MPELDRSYPKPRPSAYYADRARTRRAVLAQAPTRPSVDELFAGICEPAAGDSAMPRPSTWMRADGGAS